LFFFHSSQVESNNDNVRIQAINYRVSIRYKPVVGAAVVVVANIEVVTFLLFLGTS